MRAGSMEMVRQLGSALTGSAPGDDGSSALAAAYWTCLLRADRLRADARRAPAPGSREELLALAGAETELAERLRESVGGIASASPPAAPEHFPPGRNHWARLVNHLEAHRAAAHRYREMATRLTERSPAKAAIFERLGGAQAGICRRLRSLIARADPQAID
ncbi:hypothetical protein L6Q96_07750 [Candidatus Binatia bacterium]|nr:hypothetical protein [Candidatus Binatia bacterium]